MKKPHYQGRRDGDKPRLFYINDGNEVEVTYALEVSNITFIADIEWRGDGRQLLELARTIIWHATHSHRQTHLWGPSFAWEKLGFLQDDWIIPVDEVNRWLARKELAATEPDRPKLNGRH